MGKPQTEKPVPKKQTTQVRVALQPAGPGGLVVSRNINCPGDKRCGALEKLKLSDFQIPEGSVCSQEYGGPSTAWVVGTIRGRSVQYQLSVRDGCQIALWNRLAPALGLPHSGNHSGIS